MTGQRRDYVAYMLRLWRTRSEGEWLWRASLENPHSGERHGFAGLDALFAFLRTQAAEVLDADGDIDGRREGA